jgi:hypothetical protein
LENSRAFLRVGFDAANELRLRGRYGEEQRCKGSLSDTSIIMEMMTVVMAAADDGDLDCDDDDGLVMTR